MKAEVFMLSALTATGKASLAVCSPLQISPTGTALQWAEHFPAACPGYRAWMDPALRAAGASAQSQLSNHPKITVTSRLFHHFF